MERFPVTVKFFGADEADCGTVSLEADPKMTVGACVEEAIAGNEKYVSPEGAYADWERAVFIDFRVKNMPDESMQVSFDRKPDGTLDGKDVFVSQLFGDALYDLPSPEPY